MNSCMTIKDWSITCVSPTVYLNSTPGIWAQHFKVGWVGWIWGDVGCAFQTYFTTKQSLWSELKLWPLVTSYILNILSIKIIYFLIVLTLISCLLLALQIKNLDRTLCFPNNAICSWLNFIGFDALYLQWIIQRSMHISNKTIFITYPLRYKNSHYTSF